MRFIVLYFFKLFVLSFATNLNAKYTQNIMWLFLEKNYVYSIILHSFNTIYHI